MLMKTGFSALLLFACLAAFSACNSTSTATSGHDVKVKTAEQAIFIALNYLSEQSHAKQYLADIAEADEREGDWQVMVKYADWKERRPSVALVSISKATGEAIRLPLR